MSTFARRLGTPALNAPPGVVAAGVIAEAHRRQRKRRALLATAMITLAILIPIAAHQPATTPTTTPNGRDAVSMPAGAVLSQSPYLGVACPVANSIACDRVGLAINLRRKAISVTATIAGWPVALTNRGDRPARAHQPRTEFDGFLQPAGIINHLHVTSDAGPKYWYGDSFPPPVPIRLSIDYGHGNHVIALTRVQLATGWG